MDDEGNDQYSRSPEIEDLKELCRSLNESEVKYLLIGGFAVILHGYVRATKDIDLLIDPSPENVKKIKTAMSHLPDNAIALVKDSEISEYDVVRVADEIVVDLMAKACGISYEEAESEIEFISIENVKIPVASRELLIRLKDTVRPSDKTDVQFLQMSLDAEKSES